MTPPIAVLPASMSGVVLTGHGGFDKLEFRTDLPVPQPGRGEVLIRVAASAINNTDINTRIGWYSKAVRESTAEGGTPDDADAGWTGEALHFPRIQGADCCGRIVAVGEGVNASRLGERVIVKNLLHSYVSGPFACWTFGSECDGGFAQFAKAPAAETYAVNCDWTDVELASMPCAWSTAEGMLHRAGVREGEVVLITGASGGVGSAAVQLARRRGATVIGVAGAAKADQVRALGASRVVTRGESLVAALGRDSVDVVIDIAAGPGFAELPEVLRRGGRYAVAGAIAGPIVELDVRDLYLKDLTFFGCTFYDDVVFENLVSYIERGEIRPNVGAVYPLDRIVEAQQEFLSKTTGGKIVLIVPQE